ncbi:MAG: FtsX-like permease family protein, partial [Lachnospiraceae bacterium]|nr:FtsX-like permease family protein [Lachnospiraceae bacterium]
HIVYNQLIIDSVSSTNEGKAKIEKVLDRKDVVVSTRRQNMSYATFDDEMIQHKAMGVMFSIVFLLIAFLGIITTMTRVTANQRTQIGTLKALGFSKRTITLHYISYGVIITAVGDILGAEVGMIGFPAWIFKMFEGSYITPPMHGVFTTFSLYGIVFSVAVAFIVSLLSCRKQLKDMPAITLKPEAPKFSKANIFERSFIWQKLPFSTQWNFRDILRNKIRTLMGIIGIAGCAMIMIAAFSMADSFDGIMDNQYKEINTYTTQVGFEIDVDNLTKEEYAKKYKAQLIQNESIEVASDTYKMNGSLKVIESGPYVHVLDKEFRPTKLKKNGIAVTGKMCDTLRVSEGSFIKWHLTGDDKWQYTRIDQVIRNSVEQGIVMTEDTYESLEYTFNPSIMVTRASVPKRLVDDDDNIMSVVSLMDLKESLSKSLEMMNQMVVLLVFCAVLLGIIVLYNLGILSFTEKTREVATLKVLGFKSRKIRNILQEQNIWITAMGIVLGIPLGKLMMAALCTTLGEQLDMKPLYSVMTYVYSIGGTFAVSILVNFMFSGKVKTINMVDALKGVE